MQKPERIVCELDKNLKESFLNKLDERGQTISAFMRTIIKKYTEEEAN